MAAPDRRIVIGVVTRPHGIRGAVRVKVFNEDTDVLVEGAELNLGSAEGSRRVTVSYAQPGNETWTLALEGVASREAAEALRGVELWLDRDELPAPGEGEFYHVDAVGCEVRDEAGAVLGTVTSVVTYPSVDALVVRTPKGELEVPVVEGIVTSMDLAQRVIVVDRDALRDVE